MKFVFLDIDGVLNSHVRSCNGYAGIDWENVEQFNRLLRKFPGMRIVLSSAWRYMILDNSMTLRGFEQLLLSHRVDCHGRLFDLTAADEAPEECFPCFLPREQLIASWIAAHSDLCRYEDCLVLDDLPLRFSHPVLYHQTNPHAGLTHEDVENILVKVTNATKQSTERGVQESNL